MEEVAGVAGVAGETAFDAAIVVVADAVELRGIGDRKRAQQDALDQREDGRVGADAERQRDDRGEREARRLAQLAQRVADVVE
jgi:Skp family chaperone for outer membrane proteins